MPVSAELRHAVRLAFMGRCGYCGVSEAFMGSLLEIDHFVPTSAGGTDNLDNLIYACTACNRFKRDYVPEKHSPESLRLLHPKRDDVREHIAELDQGRLIGLTSRGWFHLQQLNLNRPQLVEMRLWARLVRAQKEDLARAHEIEAKLRGENDVLQEENAKLRSTIDSLLDRHK